MYSRNAATMPYVYSPPGSNWLSKKGADTRSKTPAGNTASISELASFTYDGFNRLIASQTAAETTTYTYNALGERIKKINQNGLSTVFHYGPDGELLFERDANGNTKVYVWLEGRPLARIDNDAQIYYYHIDHLGTPQAMTDATGATVWRADYEPFGKATVKVNTVENNLRFPGQYYDRETGLHYNYFRDYDPGTGRYISSDPIGLAAGPNVYAYALGNPLSYTDPLGLDVFLCSQPALGWAPVDHQWIKTDSVEAGMGGTRGNAPGNQSGDLPGDPVQVTDHSGRSKEQGASCKEVPNVDEKKVNDQLKIGRPLGRWTPGNQCQSFAKGVLNNARNSPGASGSWSRGATGGW